MPVLCSSEKAARGLSGVVFGNQNLKIGAPIELEGPNFRVIGSVTGLRLGANSR
jgi:hypothetical protein